MQYSSVESEYLVKLIKSAIKNEPAASAPPGLDWGGLVALSKSQQVYSMIAAVLKAEDMPEKQAAELKTYNQNELLRILAMKTELEAIELELEADGIKFMLLKGSVLRSYYPQQKMRQMSDIDILYDASKRDRLYEIMSRRGFVCFNADENSDDFTKKPFYTFEFHRELFFEEADFCPKFDYIWDNAIQDKDSRCLYHMGLDDMYVYNICHMYKHFRKSCCGIRFLVDNYLFLKKENDNLNWQYIEDCLRNFGILDYEQKARALALKLFDGETLSESEAKLLYLYTDFGIYGNSEGTAVMKFSDCNEENAKGSWLRFIFKRLFPSKKEMEYSYAFLKDKPYLLCFAYIHRLFTAVFKRDKIAKEIKSVNKFNK